MPNKLDPETECAQEVRRIIRRYESLLGADATLQAIRRAIGAESNRLYGEGNYVRSHKYQVASKALHKVETGE